MKSEVRRSDLRRTFQTGKGVNVSTEELQVCVRKMLVPGPRTKGTEIGGRLGKCVAARV